MDFKQTEATSVLLKQLAGDIVSTESLETLTMQDSLSIADHSDLLSSTESEDFAAQIARSVKQTEFPDKDEAVVINTILSIADKKDVDKVKDAFSKLNSAFVEAFKKNRSFVEASLTKVKESGAVNDAVVKTLTDKLNNMNDVFKM